MVGTGLSQCDCFLFLFGNRGRNGIRNGGVRPVLDLLATDIFLIWVAWMGG